MISISILIVIALIIMCLAAIMRGRIVNDRVTVVAITEAKRQCELAALSAMCADIHVRGGEPSEVECFGKS